MLHEKKAHHILLHEWVPKRIRAILERPSSRNGNAPYEPHSWERSKSDNSNNALTLQLTSLSKTKKAETNDSLALNLPPG